MNKESNSQRAIAELRKRLLEEHASGNGLVANHLCWVAINSSTNPYTFFDLRCFYYLAVFWAPADHFLWSLNDGDVRTPSQPKTPEEKLFELMINMIWELKIEEKPAFPDAEWLATISNDPDKEEDRIAIQFATELAWILDAGSENWKQLVKDVQLASKEGSVLHKSITALEQRLVRQEPFVRAVAPSSATPSSSESHWLADGWDYLYDCEWGELSKWIRQHSPRIGVSHPDYIAFWTIVHWSRHGRFHADYKDQLESRQWGDNSPIEHDHDDQFVSMARQLSAEAKQARYLHFAERHSRLLSGSRKSAKKNHEGKLFGTYRMGVLNAIVALRQWDLGSFFKSISVLCENTIESGVSVAEFCSYPDRAVNVLFSITQLPDPKKDLQVARALDAMSDEEQRRLVERAIRCRPRDVGQSYSILEYVSDGISQKQIREVIEWLVKYDERKNYPSGGFQSCWLKPLAIIAEYGGDLSQHFDLIAPRLRAAASNPSDWKDLRYLFQHFFASADAEQAEEVAETMFNRNLGFGEVAKDHRWVAILDASRKNPAFGALKVVKEFLSKEAETEPRLSHLLELKSPSSKGSGYKDALRQTWIQYCDNTLNTADADIQNLGAGPGFSRLDRVNWTEAEPTLVRKLTKVMNSERVLLEKKRGTIEMLSILAIDGPDEQAESILGQLGSLFSGELPGRTGKFFGQNAGAAINRELLAAGAALVRRVPARAIPILFDWAKGQSWTLSTHPLRDSYYLLTSMWLLDNETAIDASASFVFAEMRLSRALTERDEEFQALAVLGYMLDWDAMNGGVIERTDQLKKEILMAVWENRLLDHQDSRNLRMRRGVAKTVGVWHQKQTECAFPFPNALETVRQQFRLDRRLRIQDAVERG